MGNIGDYLFTGKGSRKGIYVVKATIRRTYQPVEHYVSEPTPYEKLYQHYDQMVRLYGKKNVRIVKVKK